MGESDTGGGGGASDLNSNGVVDAGTIIDDFGAHSAAETAPLSTMASAMMFGTITFASASLAARMYLTGNLGALEVAKNSRSSPLNVRSFASVYTLLYHFTIFGFILLYAYICEYHPPFPHSNKTYDRDEFFFLIALVIFASAYTISKNDKKTPVKEKKTPAEMNDNNDGVGVVAEVKEANEVLNRDQTEEWKGWMQYMFLLYHYYHAEDIYNSIRIMITCYVWMTGFGNFSFFYIKGDYSAVRVLQMLWRLNFLVLFLCLTQGTTYILYYICLLHTYFFLMVYATMRIANHVNYTKWGLRMKMGILAIVIFLLWDVDSGLFRLFHFPILGETPQNGANSGSMWEWYFRSTLDHWSTFLGMVFALNFPITSLFFRKLEAQPFALHFMAKAAVGLALFGVFFMWVTGPFMLEKLDYNMTNAYYGFVPLITYIYFRNLTPGMRSHSVDLLHQIGKTTLETYLMQHHIWLTSDAKSLLTLIPGWPKVNMLVVSIIYYLIARRLYQLTLFLRGMILPNDRNTCCRNLFVLGIMIGAFYGLAISFQTLGILNLTSVAFVAIICGMLLYQTVLDSTWQAYHSGGRFSDGDSTYSGSSSKYVQDSSVASMSPPLIGTMIVFIIGIAWQGMAEVGAAKIQPLPAGCEAFVNDGVWIPLAACNEESRGAGYRDYGVSEYATCSQSNAFVWGWNETDPTTHCRFTRRDAKSLQKTLKHRTITFIGDSMTRHLYYGTMRSMGIAGSGAYNTKLPKWADLKNPIGDTIMEFKWSPLAKDQVISLKDIRARPAVAQDSEGDIKPDMVIMGGGASDRLHVFATDEDRESHRDTLRELANQMRLARKENIPVVWVIPTTINSKALTTDEKRANIKEADMEAMRALYATMGVLEGSSFVIDGPAFTASRVTESYDGVHYPLSVYDAGAQILANAMDWLLPKRDLPDEFVPPQPGLMSNPWLGFMMLCVAFLGIALFDGFFGFSYLASFFVKGVMPIELYEEAFSALHRRNSLPDLSTSGDFSSSVSIVSSKAPRSKKMPVSSTKSVVSNASTVDDEIAALIGGSTASHDIEMSSAHSSSSSFHSRGSSRR